MSGMSRRNNNIDLIDKHIGKKIYELRLARGMSRQDLGNQIDVTHQQCQKYEKGTNRVSAGRLAMISKVLSKPIEYFYEDVDQGTEPEIKTNHQRMCIEVSRNFMKIQNPVFQEAVNSLIKTMAKEYSNSSV